MTDPRIEQICAEAEIGEAARQFLDSELGKCISGMAKQETDMAMLEFADVDPSDLAKVRAIQLRVKFGLSFNDWLVELINKGNEALEAFNESQNR